MADFKRRTLQLSSGKQIRLFGNSLAIGKSLEVGEGGAPNIFSCFTNPEPGKTASIVSNPYQLTIEDLHEIADYNIRLWVDFKDSIRRNGIHSTKIFNLELPNEPGKQKVRKVAEKEKTKQDNIQNLKTDQGK